MFATPFYKLHQYVTKINMYIFEKLYYKAAKDSVIMAKDSLDGEKDLRKSILSGPGTIADGINAA